jgi:hypothetical protein
MEIGQEFEVKIKMHTTDAKAVLTGISRVREIIGEKLDNCGLQEEVDYTLEVHRIY